MSKTFHSSELESLLDVARAAQPAELSPLVARRLVREALREGDRTRRLVRVRAAALVLVAVAAVLLLVARPRTTHIELAADARPLRVALRSGDTLLIAASTRLTVLEETSTLRKVELERGAALFEVARLGKGRAFEVQTRHGTVHVLGTVFSVEADAERIVVRVHEGRVRVGERTLDAGQVWASSGAAVGKVPFAAEARSMVRARAAEPTPVVEASSPMPVIQQRNAFEQAVPSAPRAAGGALEPTAAPPRSAGSHAEESGKAAPEVVRKGARPDSESVIRARALLLAGDASAALELVGGAQIDDALLVAADALRALGRFREAVEHYERLAAQSQQPIREQAAFAAAQLWLASLRNGEQALRLIDRHALDAPAAPLRERSSVLRVDALLSLGRTSEAADHARAYLAREPETAASARMRDLLP